MRILAALSAFTLALPAFGNTICVATSRGQECHIDCRGNDVPCGAPPPPSEPLCIDGDMHFVACSSINAARCSMSFDWKQGDPDHPTVTALTPACADEAGVAASQTVTKIIKLRE